MADSTMRIKLKSVSIVLLAILIISGCGKQPQPPHEARILAFGTLIDVVIAGETKETAETAISNLEKMFQQLHQEWHAWEPGLLHQTNKQLKEGTAFTPHPKVMSLIQLSIPLAEKSDQLFNPAIGELINLWGFQGKKRLCSELPSKEKIEKLVAKQPSLSDLQFNGEKLVNGNPTVKIDFGAVGKGYGIDLGIDRLRQLGINNAIINAGGDLRAIGDKGERPWRIAVRKPSGDGVFAFIEVSGDESVFTSGDYERNTICNGERIHHIIDPRSGRPAKGTRSVTVIHSDAATADAAATALFIAGPDDWHRIASQMGIRYVALLDEQGELHMNPAMQKRLKLLDHNIRIKLSKPIQTR